MGSVFGDWSLEGDESGTATDGGGYFGIGDQVSVGHGRLGSIGENLSSEIDGAGGTVGDQFVCQWEESIGQSEIISTNQTEKGIDLMSEGGVSRRPEGQEMTENKGNREDKGRRGVKQEGEETP